MPSGLLGPHLVSIISGEYERNNKTLLILKKERKKKENVTEKD